MTQVMIQVQCTPAAGTDRSDGECINRVLRQGLPTAAETSAQLTWHMASTKAAMLQYPRVSVAKCSRRFSSSTVFTMTLQPVRNELASSTLCDAKCQSAQNELAYSQRQPLCFAIAPFAGRQAG